MFSSLDSVIQEIILRLQQLHVLAEKYTFLKPSNLLNDKYECQPNNDCVDINKEEFLVKRKILQSFISIAATQDETETRMLQEVDENWFLNKVSWHVWKEVDGSLMKVVSEDILEELHLISLRQVLSATETTRLENDVPFRLPPLTPANTTIASFPPPPPSSPNFFKPMLLALACGWKWGMSILVGDVPSAIFDECRAARSPLIRLELVGLSQSHTPVVIENCLTGSPVTYTSRHVLMVDIVLHAGPQDSRRSDLFTTSLETNSTRLMICYLPLKSMFFDEDGDLAHEFFVEVPPTRRGCKATMKKVLDNLTPQGLALQPKNAPLLSSFQYRDSFTGQFQLLLRSPIIYLGGQTTQLWSYHGIHLGLVKWSEVLATDPEVPSLIPGASRLSRKQWVWNRRNDLKLTGAQWSVAALESSFDSRRESGAKPGIGKLVHHWDTLETLTTARLGCASPPLYTSLSCGIKLLNLGKKRFVIISHLDHMGQQLLEQCCRRRNQRPIITLGTPIRDSNLNLPVIGSLVYCMSSVLDERPPKDDVSQSSGVIDNCLTPPRKIIIFSKTFKDENYIKFIACPHLTINRQTRKPNPVSGLFLLSRNMLQLTGNEEQQH
uniref:Uncharacterized protein n=1 Tax=Timema tahoe TaxID=61484 RepID=A0A7R9IK67_9NEOP|nr:unnamed protein product [Timema tahoe]